MEWAGPGNHIQPDQDQISKSQCACVNSISYTFTLEWYQAIQIQMQMSLHNIHDTVSDSLLLCTFSTTTCNATTLQGTMTSLTGWAKLELRCVSLKWARPKGKLSPHFFAGREHLFTKIHIKRYFILLYATIVVPLKNYKFTTTPCVDSNSLTI